jgi:hypothetical protein
VEDYARRRAKSEKDEIDFLSEWIKSMKGILKPYIKYARKKYRFSLLGSPLSLYHFKVN